MDIRESFSEAIQSLSGNKLRSVLTMLGVIIGVGAVIALVSLGQGVQLFVRAEFSGIGTNLVIVQPGKTETQGAGPPPAGGVKKLEDRDVEAIRRGARYVQAITPITLGAARVESGRFARNTNILGADQAFTEVFNIDAEVGRFLEESDVMSQKRVAVVGRKVKHELFGSASAVGEMITVSGTAFRIIGVTMSKGATLGFDFDDVVYLPVGVAQRLFGQEGYFGLRARATSEKVLDAAAAEIKNILIERHGEEDFTIITQVEMFKTLDKILSMLTLFLSGIAAISLLVGGIGIMNIMLVTVRERTREIGLRKAIGASRQDILLHFLIEAVVLSTIGGTFGIALGAGGPQIIHLLSPDFQPVTTLGSIGLAFGFSLGVGVVFGVFPAIQAARLDPIVALRYE